MRRDRRAIPPPRGGQSKAEPYRGEISVELAPRAVNDILRLHSGLELFAFAQEISHSFWLLARRRELFAPRELTKYLDGLAKLRFDILARIRRIDRTFETVTDQEIIDYYELGRFFDKIRFLIDTKDEWSETRRLGPGLGVISIIAVRWGRLARESGTKAAVWPLLADLYMWFWERLRGYSYYEIANLEKNEGYDIETFLRVQYSRYKNEEFLGPHQCEDQKISGATVFGDSYTWEIQRPIFITRFLLANKYSGEPIQPIHQMVLQIYERHGYDVWGWARAATYVPEGLPDEIALKSLPRVPPLIIFPDGSYFSTDF
jgi:hypothetical protein